jgi:hypothetical protein
MANSRQPINKAAVMPVYHIRVREIMELEVDAEAPTLDEAKRKVGVAAMHMNRLSPHWKQVSWEVEGMLIDDLDRTP